MKYDFDREYSRIGSDSIKWEKQLKFGTATGLLPFWIADTDFATLPEAVEAMRKRLDHPIFGYTFTASHTVKAIQGWYKRRHGVDMPLEAFSPAQGVVTAIWFSLRALTKTGDKVLVFTPVYDPFFAAASNQGRELAACPLTYDGTRYSIDFNLFEEMLKSGVKAMVLCNPHNPVGRVWTEAEIKTIVELCKKYGVWLLSDEIHGDIVLYGGRYTSAARYADIYSNMIIYTAISKTFNMAGLDSSCCIIPDPEVKAVQEASARQAWIMGPNVMANCAIEACYTYGDNWVDELNLYLSENADIVMERLSEIPGINPVKPEGTYLMWLDCGGLGIPSGELVKRLAADYGMAIGDGTVYKPESEGFLRFNIGCTRKTLQQGLDKLAALAGDLKGV